MQIQLNTDSNINGTAALEAHVTSTIEARLERFGEDVTRVEVHLADESAGRSTAADKRCLLEARLAWRSPVSVTSHSATVEDALTAAIGKLVTVLGRETERRGHRKGAASIRTSSQPPEAPIDQDAHALTESDPDRADRDAPQD